MDFQPDEQLNPCLKDVRARGGAELSDLELSCFRHLCEIYGVRNDADELAARWRKGKEALIRVLGGHSLEARIEFADVERAGELLTAPPFDRCNREIFSRSNPWPTLEEVASGRLSTGEKLAKKVAKDIPPGERREDFLRCYSEFLAEVKANGKLRLSVSPVELLIISDSSHFHTCHSIDGFARVGNLTYLVDVHTLVAYYYKQEKPFSYTRPLAECWPYKLWRELIYVDVGAGSAIVSRQYPGSREPLAFASRSLLFSRLAEFHKLPNERTIKSGHDSGSFKIESDGGKDPYVDYGCFRTVKLKGKGSSPRILLPACPVFVGPPCHNCEGELDEGDLYYGPDGYLYCESCFDEYFTRCENCETTIDREDAYYYETRSSREAYCEECFNDLFAPCENCGTAVRRDDAFVFGSDEMYCENCYLELFSDCESCGKTFPKDELTEVRWELVCETCREEREREEA